MVLEWKRKVHDAVVLWPAPHDFAHQLAIGGEYSGAPTKGQNYKYTKIIVEYLDLNFMMHVV